MAEALKHQFFTPSFYEALLGALEQQFKISPELSVQLQALTPLELMDKMRKTAEVLQPVLEQEAFDQTLVKLERILAQLPAGLETMWAPHWVGNYSNASVAEKLAALKQLTVYGSSEFGIRSVLREHWNEAYPTVLSWAQDPNEHIRRLASEGTRPLLPWGERLYAVKENPELTIDILDALKKDDSLYVRKSVANHLNDHSKHHSDFLLKHLAVWDADDVHTRWILKHGLRTVLKSGDQRAYALLGYNSNLVCQDLKVDLPESIPLGGKGNFEFEVQFDEAPKNLMIDYQLRYPRPGGKTYTKVFRLKTVEGSIESSFSGRGTLSFVEMTTRKSYAGTHQFSLLFNGEVFYSGSFAVF